MMDPLPHALSSNPCQPCIARSPCLPLLFHASVLHFFQTLHLPQQAPALLLFSPLGFILSLFNFVDIFLKFSISPLSLDKQLLNKVFVFLVGFLLSNHPRLKILSQLSLRLASD